MYGNGVWTTREKKLEEIKRKYQNKFNSLDNSPLCPLQTLLGG